MSASWLRRPPSPAALLLGVRIAAVAAAVPLLLRLRLDRLARLLEPRRVRPQPAPADVERLVGRIDHVLAAGRPLVRPGCLTRGVTRFWFLRRAGVPVDLVFGMGRPVGDFEGHCWLVRDAEPWLEKVDPRPVYVESYRIAHRPA
jgi:hypothetical protein